MTNPELILLTNINKIIEDRDILSSLTGSIIKSSFPDDEESLKKLFNEKKFILSVINGDSAFNESYLAAMVSLLKTTRFPALIIAGKSNIKKYLELFPITVDFLFKPVTYFELHMRVNRIMEIYKLSKVLTDIQGIEKEIKARENVLELTRRELIQGAETIKALDIALELSRHELLDQKEEIMAWEKVLEVSRKDKIELLSNIKALEKTLSYSDEEKVNYEKEIGAIEGFLANLKKQHGRIV